MRGLTVCAFLFALGCEGPQQTMTVSSNSWTYPSAA